MKVTSVRFSRYRSIRDEMVKLASLNLLIGPNASGKSTIIDGLRLLNEGVREKDFADAVYTRGGIVHLAWKGEDAHNVDIVACFEEGSQTFEWSVRLVRHDFNFSIDETVFQIHSRTPPSKTELLVSKGGKGHWWSGQSRVNLDQSPTACALTAAAADASFAARTMADFVRRWGFFDPSPVLLRRASGRDALRLDGHGGNLAARLYALSKDASPEVFNRILDATRSVLGIPQSIDFKESEDGRVYFMQSEPGLHYRVHQVGASSGTLRILALMTALFEETGSTLVGIEEPENHIHPSALTAFAEHLRKGSEKLQIVVTTHSPLLLDALDDPSAVCVVTRTEDGTRVRREANPEAVRKALEESGFGLGEFYQTKGFGG